MKRILIFEFASACPLEYKNSILAEGFSMLKLVAEGLERSGHSAIVPLNSGIMKWDPQINADRIIEITSSEKMINKISKIAEKYNTDFVFPVAPDDKLAGIVEFLNSSGIPCIAPEPDAIEISADKWMTYLNLKNAGIPMPRTMRIEEDTDISRIESNFKYPLIIKKRCGVSCEGLYKVKNRKELSETLSRSFDSRSKVSKFRRQSRRIEGKALEVENIFNIINKEKSNFIAQELIEGIDASVTVFSNGKNSVAVSLNRQDIRLSSSGSEYIGGEVPFYHPQQKEAFKAAELAVNKISGLKGAMGVDFVLSDKAYVIEINPRITTSMIGLELASGMNIGYWALSSYHNELPDIPEFKKKIRFNKEFRNGICKGLKFEEAE